MVMSSRSGRRMVVVLEELRGERRGRLGMLREKQGYHSHPCVHFIPLFHSFITGSAHICICNKYISLRK